MTPIVLFLIILSSRQSLRSLLIATEDEDWSSWLRASWLVAAEGGAVAGATSWLIPADGEAVDGAKSWLIAAEGEGDAGAIPIKERSSHLSAPVSVSFAA